MINLHAGDVILSEEKIKAGVNNVAAQLNTHYTDAVVITVVPGGIIFTADLVRNLNFYPEMDFISCPHIPGERNNSSSIVFSNNTSIKNKDVIVIDDAIESGGTMKRLVDHLWENYQPKSIAVATLFVKPGRIDIPVQQFYAYEMKNDELLIGYGLPWNHKYRNLRAIYALKVDD